jgi:acetyl esterase/lipase
MKHVASAALIVLAMVRAASGQPQRPVTDGELLRLWDGAAPGALGEGDADVPALTVYLPRATAAAVDAPAIVVCPGGGYRNLATNHEGRQVANYLNSLGIAAFVLRYRLGPQYHHPVELGDVQRALRIVRSHAGAWHLAPERIGVLGFSAGGHLAMTASTQFDAGNPSAADAIDRASSRPDFAVLGYPVISMTAPWTHAGSRTNLLGDHPDAALATRLSGENAVTAATPPTFIFHTNADTTVPAENSLFYFLALRKAGVPAELHVFERGPHGVGLANDDAALSEWSKLLANWLRVHRVIN